VHNICLGSLSLAQWPCIASCMSVRVLAAALGTNLLQMNNQLHKVLGLIHLGIPNTNLGTQSPRPESPTSRLPGLGPARAEPA
jgi:hypothetical protein